MVKLNVPLWGQPQRRSQCVPTCIKMILEHLRMKYGDSIPRIRIKKISKIVKMDIDGTIPKNVENMNAYLCKGNPVVEFKPSILEDFREIKKELLEKKRPVIVWINNEKPPDIFWHAVVVIGFDPETNMVFYNDPLDKVEKIEEVGVFSSKWMGITRMVKIDIFKTEQRHIAEWTPKDVEGEDEE